MTVTSSGAATPSAGPIAAPKLVSPRRRSQARIAASVAIVVVFALAGWWFYRTQTAQLPYLAVSQQVPIGTPISKADLTIAYLNGAGGLSPIPADQASRVLGKQAAVTLVPGTLLTTAQLADKVFPAPGQLLVGISLKATALPATVLHPGDKVQLVQTPDPRGAVSVTGRSGADPALLNPPTTPAAVVDVGSPTPAGDRVVDVTVAATVGPHIAALAAAGRIAIVVSAGS
ncbi:SAF domain-containing protein [Actinoplanes sp. CA-054009]